MGGLVRLLIHFVVDPADFRTPALAVTMFQIEDGVVTPVKVVGQESHFLMEPGRIVARYGSPKPGTPTVK